MQYFFIFLYVLLLVRVSTLWAERPEIGLRASLPLIPLQGTIEPELTCIPPSSLPNCGQSESMGRRGLWGVSISLPLRGRLGLRLEPAYQRVSFDYLSQSLTSGNVVSYQQTTTANRWELPVLLEWRWSRHLRVGAGGTWSYVSGERSLSILTVPPAQGGYVNRFPLRMLARKQIFGLTAAVELPYRTPLGTFAPELRYSRWTGKHFGLRWPLDQVTVGLAWRW